MDSLLDTAPCGFFSFQDDGILLQVNTTLSVLLGYRADELSGQHLNIFLPVAGRLFYQTHFFPMLTLHGKVEEIYLTLHTSNGEAVPVLVNAIRSQREGATVNDCIVMPIRRRNEFEEALIRARDAAEEACRARDQANLALEQARNDLEAKHQQLLALNTRLMVLATTDALTGLKNRRVFLEMLSERLAFCQRYPLALSVILLDVDYFKRVNDTFGHPVGDQYLSTLAEILTSNARSIDVVARYGGEEFALLLPGTDKAGALRMAERLRSAVESHLWPHTPITISAGVATLTPSLQQEDTLLNAADQALYHAKQKGRNRVVHAEDLTN